MKKLFRIVFLTVIAVAFSCNKKHPVNPENLTTGSCDTRMLSVDQVPDTAALLSADPNRFVPVAFFRPGALDSLLQSAPDTDYVGMYIVQGSDNQNHVVMALYTPKGEKAMSTSCYSASVSAVYDSVANTFSFADTSYLPNCCPWHPGCPGGMVGTVSLSTCLK